MPFSQTAQHYRRAKRSIKRRRKRNAIKYARHRIRIDGRQGRERSQVARSCSRKFLSECACELRVIQMAPVIAGAMQRFWPTVRSANYVQRTAASTQGGKDMNPVLVKPGLFRDRREAGRLLAEKLATYANRPDVGVLRLPRGGVPGEYEVARALGAALDVFVVRKLGVPGYEELAMGAVATGGVRVLNDQLVERLGMPGSLIDAVTPRERQELARRERLYRGGRSPPDLRSRTVILVDIDPIGA